MEDILAKKEMLKDFLEDDFDRYWALLQRRFHNSKHTHLTKEAFDEEITEFLPVAAIKLHTEFMNALFTKIDKSDSYKSILKKEGQFSNSNIQQFMKLEEKSNVQDEINPTQSDALTNLPPHRILRYPGNIGDHIPVMVFPKEQECTPYFPDFPSPELVHGRILTIIMEQSLGDAQEKCVDLTLQATRTLIKNIVSAVLSRRSNYMCRNACLSATDEKRRLENPRVIPKIYPWNRLTLPTSSKESTSLAKDPENPRKRSHIINPEELYMALRVHRNVIPNHSIYTVNMERILSQLYQPSEEENMLKMQQEAEEEEWEKANEEQEKMDKYRDLLSKLA